MGAQAQVEGGHCCIDGIEVDAWRRVEVVRKRREEGGGGEEAAGGGWAEGAEDVGDAEEG